MSDLYAEQLEMQLRFAEEQSQEREMVAYEQGKLDGAREFAEWLCGKYSRMKQDSIGFEKYQNIYWKSIDEVLAEWQKEVNNVE